MGSLEGHAHAYVCRETVKLKGRLSSHLFQEQFPDHYAEIMHALPFKEYINPKSGLLNLAVKLPKELPMPELGPCMYISYDEPEEFMQTNIMTRLCYDSNDVVRIRYYKYICAKSIVFLSSLFRFSLLHSVVLHSMGLGILAVLFVQNIQLQIILFINGVMFFLKILDKPTFSSWFMASG